MTRSNISAMVLLLPGTVWAWVAFNSWRGREPWLAYAVMSLGALASAALARRAGQP